MRLNSTPTLLGMVAVFLWLFCIPAESAAATYYIDCASGDDANNGTSTSTPWLRAPGMQGFSATYSHVAGDSFIFKGGVTCPEARFPMTISNSGTSGSRDYYGVDQTWFTGGAWARPVFDLESQLKSWGVKITGSDVDFDNIEIVNLQIPIAGRNGAASLKVDGAEVIAKNVRIRNWTAEAGGSDSGCSGGICGGGTNFKVWSATIDCSPACLWGSALRSINGEIKDSVVSEVCNMVVGAKMVHHNVFRGLRDCADSAQHENGIEVFCHTDIYNNILADIDAGVAILIASTFDTKCRSLGDSHLYNNVIYDSSPIPIQLDASSSPANARYYVWNNTLVSLGANPTQALIRTVDRGSGAIHTVELKNNHYITDRTSDPLACCNPGAALADVTNLTNENNTKTTIATATSQGYIDANDYQPTDAIDVSVEKGVTLTFFTTDRLGVARPQGQLWDLGAYEFVTNRPAPPTNVRTVVH